MPRKTRLLPYLREAKSGRLEYVRRVPPQLQKYLGERRYLTQVLPAEGTNVRNKAVIRAWTTVNQQIEAQLAAARAQLEAEQAPEPQATPLSPRDTAGIAAEPFRKLLNAGDRGQISGEMEQMLAEVVLIATQAIAKAGEPGDVQQMEQAKAAIAERTVTSPGFATATGVGAAALGTGALGIGALNAYTDQANEYLPTDPMAVAGRMIQNANPFQGQAVGLDPLADARNKVAEARQLVGTEAMLEALTEDEVIQLRVENEAAMTPLEIEGMNAVRQMIDARAAQLMEQPIQRSDGTVMPMPYDQAQRIATEQVNMELRAGQAY